jgi:hypothetical protein
MPKNLDQTRSDAEGDAAAEMLSGHPQFEIKNRIEYSFIISGQ